MRGGSKALASGLLLLLACAPGGVRADASRVETRPLLARLVERIDRAAGFQAEFRQVNRWAAFDAPDTSRGRLTLAPPSRFRLAYDVPAGQVVGGDGRYVWTFVPQDRQVLRAPLDETTGWGDFFTQALDAPLDALAESRRGAAGSAVVHVRLQPRAEWSLATLYIELDVPSGVPVGYGYTDEEGNAAEFTFSDARFPEALDESLFRFSVPDGYELFEAR
jgi:outer membrane lipoprotein-sorting protein